jgi:hypothetical protein
MPGILMPGILMPRTAMPRVQHQKTPGVSKTYLSGSEPEPASVPAPRAHLENPWGLFSRPPSPVSHGPSSIAQSILPPFHSSNLQSSLDDICSSSTAFVPQTTNVANPPITHNSPRKLALKSQESYLFLEKCIFNFFYSKISPPTARARFSTFKRSDVETFKRLQFKRLHRPSSTVNPQPSIFDRQHLILEKLNSNNKSEQILLPPYMTIFS